VHGRALVGALVAAALLGAPVRLTTGTWTDAQAVGANTFATATLQPPTGLAATASCQSTTRAKITLTWTAAALADGYDVYRSQTNGGPYAFVVHVNGGATTSYTDGNLRLGRTYYYVVRSTRNAWTSGNSNQAQATTPVICP
jgi:hypothetical protein